jgi:hypothetical protein
MEIGIFTLQISHTVINITDVVFVIAVIVLLFLSSSSSSSRHRCCYHFASRTTTSAITNFIGTLFLWPIQRMMAIFEAVTCSKSCSYLRKDVAYNL